MILKRRAPYCKGLWRAFAKEFENNLPSFANIATAKFYRTYKLTLRKQKQRTFSRLSEFRMVAKISFLWVRPKNWENYYYIRVTWLLLQSTSFIADTVGTSSQCPLQRESIIARIYFSHTSVICFFLGFSCCPFYRGVRYSQVPARRELTVYKRLMFDLNDFKQEVFTRKYLSRCRSFALRGRFNALRASCL